METIKRRCSACKCLKSTDCFSLRTPNKKGVRYYRSACKRCCVKATQAKYIPRPWVSAYATPGHKRCSKCEVVKPFSEYVKSKNTSHGVTPACKICTRALKKQYRNEKSKTYYFRNKEKVSERVSYSHTLNMLFLSDTYLKGLVPIKSPDVPMSLVEVKREFIKLKRKLNEKCS